MRGIGLPKAAKVKRAVRREKMVAILASGKFDSERALSYFRNHKPYCCDYGELVKEKE